MPKTVCDSRVEHSQLMRPHQGNFTGNVHGGTILAMMDEVAYTCASQYAESYCVTASVDMVDFLEPVRVGEVVTMKAAVNYVGRSSMEVGISVEAGQPHDKSTKRRTNRCYFTMVALDDDRKPRTVPRLVLESAEDRKWNCEAELRRTLRKRYRTDLDAGVCSIDGAPDS